MMLPYVKKRLEETGVTGLLASKRDMWPPRFTPQIISHLSI